MTKKNTILVTGGAGFVGTNLIKRLVSETKFKILSLDDYSSGSKLNHINNKRVKYLRGKTQNIVKIIKQPEKIKTIFHLGEFARIYQSFLKMKVCIDSNFVGTNTVFNFCLLHKIQIVYSATSASLGNKGEDKNLSPYAFTKSKNLELLENLKKWFNLKFEIIYFYNVYGPRHIKSGEMATVIGIFENLFKKKKPLTIVRPGNQTRRFTHISDTVDVCIEAWKKNRCCHYSISHKKSHSIKEVAKMFKSKYKYLKARPGERYSSALTNMSLNNKIIKRYGKIYLKDYVTSFIKGENL